MREVGNRSKLTLLHKASKLNEKVRCALFATLRFVWFKLSRGFRTNLLFLQRQNVLAACSFLEWRRFILSAKSGTYRCLKVLGQMVVFLKKKVRDFAAAVFLRA